MNLLILASILMLVFSLFAYAYDVKRTNNIVCLRALYSLFFLGSLALSFLKLSNLSLDYGYRFFIVIFIAVVGFYFSYEFANKFHSINTKKIKYLSNTKTKDYVYKILLLTMALSFISFLIEVSVLKFIPLFVKDVPHAIYASLCDYFVYICAKYGSFILLL